ncbi:unnamed protein product [Spirodela intermedia]|uniref:Uncharacterized protein n=1 Tax=Spirodela intermedia TaxID=51605 RepID=A0A7I8I9D8_SPIIN|nr:unnamed protein product [Spirodela intermedia]CAA6654094.1 unnamed protein product [Spirodela intermedia]
MASRDSLWTKMTWINEWVVESSLMAVIQRSRETATLRLSSGCHPTERSWMERWRLISQ